MGGSPKHKGHCRRPITAALAVVFAIAAAAAARAATPGDTDCDGAVSDADLNGTLTEIFDGDGAKLADAGGGTYNSCAGVDANGDGRITIADGTAIMRLRPIHVTPTRTRTVTRTPTKTRTPTLTPTRTKTRTPKPPTPTRPPASPTRTFTALPTTPLWTPGGPTNTHPPTRTPTPTGRATPTFGGGPDITLFAIDANGDGQADTAVAGGGEEPYKFSTGGQASGFRIIVEGRPGQSGKPVGDSIFSSDPQNPSARPDLQIESSNPLGGGDDEVCEGLGIVPAVDVPDFEPTQAVSDALNDFACNFSVALNPEETCTLDPETFENVFAKPNSTIQFCYEVPSSAFFFPGETTLVVRLRDTSGGVGSPMTIIIDVQ